MDNDLNFADAMHPDVTSVLGVPLRAYTVGHQFLLKRIRSPFAIGGTVNLDQLISAVWICSRPYAEGVRLLYGGVGIHLRLFSWATALREKSDKNLVYEHSARLAQFIEAANQGPENIWRKPDAEKTFAPFTLLMLHDLASNFNMTLERIMDTPLRAAEMMRYQTLTVDKTIEWRGGTFAKRKEQAHAE